MKNLCFILLLLTGLFSCKKEYMEPVTKGNLKNNSNEGGVNFTIHLDTNLYDTAYIYISDCDTCS